MKVLVLGLPRTGTQSIANALSELGVSPVYHMREVAQHGHEKLWAQAFEAKVHANDGRQAWQRQDFDQMLATFEGVTEFPAALFPEELVAAYPEAAIVLSVRHEDLWYESMMATLCHAHMNGTADPAAPMAVLRAMYHKHCWGDDFPANGRAFFRSHNDLVRRRGAGRKLLEYDVKMGWEPLTEFLGLPPFDPAREFPRSDDWVTYKKAVEEQRKAQAP